MILRVYGKRVEGVEPTFNSLAITSVGFRRNREFTMPIDEFEEEYERVDGHELTSSAEGSVQIEVQDELLAHLERQLRDLVAGLEPGAVVLIESQRGVDHPRTKEKKDTLVVAGENRLYFHWWIEPPLRVGVYRKRS